METEPAVADAMMNASAHTHNNTISNSALAVARLPAGDGGQHAAESQAAALALCWCLVRHSVRQAGAWRCSSSKAHTCCSFPATPDREHA